MDINELLKQFENHKDDLTAVLDDCKDGPDELVLLASIMKPLLQSITDTEKDLSKPFTDQKALKPDVDEDETVYHG